MATAALIGALRVTLGLDTAAFEAGAAKASRQSAQLESGIAGHMARIEGHMGRLKLAAAGLATSLAGLGVLTAAREALDYASSLAEVAQQLGVTTKTLQEYRYIGTQVGIDQAQMDTGLQKLTRSIGLAAGGGKAQAKAFAELGVAVKDANGHVRATDDILPELIAKFSAMESPAQRAALEVALFGKAGQQLDTLLAGGIDQVDNLRKAAADLGLVLSEDQIANADNTADKLAELKTVLAANIAGAVANNARAIYEMVDAVERLASKIPAALNWLGQLRERMNLASGYINSYTPLAWFSGARREAAAKEIATARGKLWNLQGRPGEDKVTAAGMGWIDQFRTSLRAGAAIATPAGDGDKPKRSGGGRRGGGGGRVARSAEDTLQQTLDALLPDDAERTRLAAQAKQLRAALARGGLDQGTFDRAMGAVGERYDRISRLTGPGLLANDNEAGATPFDMKPAKVELLDLTHILDNVKVTNGEVRESFVEMARDATNALQNLAGSIRGGGLLDILGSLLDAFMSLGSAGVFGGKVASGLRGVAGARALGGPVDAGRTYLVGERGPELFTAPGAGRIIPNGGFGGGAPLTFDLRGAVVTADLLQQMNGMIDIKGGQMITANNATLMKRSRQRLGR